MKDLISDHPPKNDSTPPEDDKAIKTHVEMVNRSV